MRTKLIVIVGPTASGKTSLSIEAAKHFNGEIISADSMQIYKYMQIATAKPSADEMQGIRHYMIDFLEPSSIYSVGQYVLDAGNAIDEIASKGKIPVVCGGTGLYVDSLINGIDFTENSRDLNLRAELEKTAEENGAEYLLDILKEFDPQSALRLSEQVNIKRIIRAIEFYKTTGTTISEQNINSRKNGSKYDSIIFGLTAADRNVIYERINRRVDIMVEQGLLDEAKAVLSSDLSETSAKAIGYKQLKPYLDGEKTLDECIERLKTETRHYAKRQLTWFKRNDKINWIEIDKYKTTESQLGYMCDIINQKGFLNG